MQVLLDRDKCQGVGLCESIRPDLFELDDDGELQIRSTAIGPVDHTDLAQAVEACPTRALRLVR